MEKQLVEVTGKIHASKISEDFFPELWSSHELKNW
jgi:hypothetical protein